MRLIGIGGTLRPNSTTERALRIALDSAAAYDGTTVEMFDGPRLAQLPLYRPESIGRPKPVEELIDALRAADGVIVASPGYHGTVSGVVKNALDYIEDLREDGRPYLGGRAFGCIATAAGWQAAVTTLTSLRTIAHALRAWPTPLGAALNTLETLFDDDGRCSERVTFQLETVGSEVAEFASRAARLDWEQSDGGPRALGSVGAAARPSEGCVAAGRS